MINISKHIKCSVLSAVLLLISTQVLQAQGNPSTPFLFSQDLSSPFVNSFAEDNEGFIWIGTNHGLNRYNGSFYDIHYTYSNDNGLNNDNITAMMEDEVGDLWLLSESGLSVRRNSLFYHYGQSGFAPIWQMVDIDKDYLVVADNRGVDKINKSDLTLAYHYKSLKIGIPKPIGVADNGCVLMTREKNGSDQIVLLDEQMREIGTLNFSRPTVVNSILHDSDGSNWIVTSDYLYHLATNNLFDHKEVRNSQIEIEIGEPFLEFTSGRDVLFLCEYDKENLVLGVRGSGLFLIDKLNAKMRPIHVSEKLNEQKCICFVDSHRNIWLSDGMTGFRLLSPEMEYEHLSFADCGNSSFKHLCIDSKNRLWVRSSRDLICYDIDTQKYCNFSSPETFYSGLFIDSQNRLWTIEQYSQIKCFEIADDPNNSVGAKLLITKHFYFGESAFSISEAADGKIWFALADRFAVIDNNGQLTYEEGPFKVNFSSLQTNNKSKRSFLYTVGKGIYEQTADNRFQPVGVDVSGLRIVYADDKNNLWIGSNSKGLVCYNERTKQIDYLQDHMEMGAYDVKAIEKDSWGNIWFTTSTTLFRYNPEDESIVSMHDDHMRNGNVYNLYASASDSHGRLFFGGMNGITVVDPVGLKYKKKTIPIKVEDVVISGESLYEYDGKPFTVKHYNNSIVFWFSGLDFFLGKQLSYEYMLDGYEKTWRPVGHQTRISYSELPAGDYNLKIRVKSDVKSSTTGELSVPFTVKPAPWFTIWAKILYAIIILGLIYYGFKILIRWRVREERYSLLQQREAINRGYVRFVTNISHEFRTPLSMMYAPLIEFLSGKTFDGRDKELLDMIKCNAERLRVLTEQVLSAGKGYNKEKDLKVCPQDAVISIKQIIDNFLYLASEKNITLEYKAPEQLYCPLDFDKVDRIVSNLLSNAIKYTEDNGHIVLEIVQNAGNIDIKVSDNGIGVPKDKEKNLFKRLERLDMENRDPSIVGSGIGLYYSHYLSEIHKGSLTYSPNCPKGSVFTLSLPLSAEAYNEKELIGEELKTSPKETAIAENTHVEKQGSLFIVEDNADVRQFLQMCLGSRYNLFVSANGAEALDNLTTCIPDLIISDIMMPVMDGHELCRRIKESPEYGHIPIILLTAINDNDKKVEMIKTGADGYMQKPFDPRHLVVMVENLIENRRRVQRAISALTSSTLADAVASEKTQAEGEKDLLNQSERNFLERFYAELDKHLADEAFGVDEMAQAMNMGNAKLYSKIKTLTGQTPKAFFVTYRMNKAMELLKSGQYTVSEVGYMVGATSPAVFSRSFKHQFGVSPSSIEK